MKYFSNNQNTLSIFLFHGVIEKKNKGIRNYNLKHIEKGVGKSYVKRRNSRISLNKDYRISQFKSEIEGLKRVLEGCKKRLDNI